MLLLSSKVKFLLVIILKSVCVSGNTSLFIMWFLIKHSEKTWLWYMCKINTLYIWISKKSGFIAVIWNTSKMFEWLIQSLEYVYNIDWSEVVFNTRLCGPRHVNPMNHRYLVFSYTIFTQHIFSSCAYSFLFDSKWFDIRAIWYKHLVKIPQIPLPFEPFGSKLPKAAYLTKMQLFCQWKTKS